MEKINKELPTEDVKPLEPKAYFFYNEGKSYVNLVYGEAPDGALEVPFDFIYESPEWIELKDGKVEVNTQKKVEVELAKSLDLEKKQQKQNLKEALKAKQDSFEQELDLYLSKLKDISPEFKAILDERIAARLTLLGEQGAGKLV